MPNPEDVFCKSEKGTIFFEDWLVLWILENRDGRGLKEVHSFFSSPLRNLAWTHLSIGISGASVIPLLTSTSVAFNLCYRPSLNLAWQLDLERHLLHSESYIFGDILKDKLIQQCSKKHVHKWLLYCMYYLFIIKFIKQLLVMELVVEDNLKTLGIDNQIH